MDGIRCFNQLNVHWQHLGRLRDSAGMVILILQMRPWIKLFSHYRRSINSTHLHVWSIISYSSSVQEQHQCGNTCPCVSPSWGAGMTLKLERINLSFYCFHIWINLPISTNLCCVLSKGNRVTMSSWLPSMHFFWVGSTEMDRLWVLFIGLILI